MSQKRPGPLVLSLAGLGVLVLLALGAWQVQRLGWKNALIARVEARVSSDPVAAPGPEAWAALTPDSAEYLRIRVSGRYLPDADTLVQAVTNEGAGFWVMTPFVTDEGWTALINRGFVPSDRKSPADRPLPDGQQTVTGLLRLTQPVGGFLRKNDPAADRWYSRDTAEIAARQGLAPVAPWFLDADRTGDALPIGGLTVISFPNNHLQYALTWFAMAAGLAVATFCIARGPRSR